MPNIFNFYRNLANEMRYENAIADRHIKNFPEPQRDSQQESRILTSNEKAEEMDEVITKEKSQKKNIPSWRKHIKEIISLYNDAYANSYFATHGVGTGGHGEASAMTYLLDQKKRLDQLAAKDNSQWDKLIDKDSLERALTALIPEDNSKDNLRNTMYQMVLNRFDVIIKQMIYVLNARLSEQSAAEKDEESTEIDIPLDILSDIFYHSAEEIKEILSQIGIEVKIDSTDSLWREKVVFYVINRKLPEISEGQDATAEESPSEERTLTRQCQPMTIRRGVKRKPDDKRKCPPSSGCRKSGKAQSCKRRLTKIKF